MQLSPYIRLMRLERPIGTLLLMWPTLWALWVAGEGWPQPTIVLIFMAGTLIMRSAGCVINDIADRHVDGKVTRTKMRPLATREISVRGALVLFVALLLVALWLVLQLNRLSLYVAIIAALLAIVYPFCKRVTHLPQLVLALAFSSAIAMAFAAHMHSFPLSCWLLILANVCWTVAYDTQYAIVDRDDDVLIGVKSTAILFGKYDLVCIALLQSISIACLVAVGLIEMLNLHFYVALLLATLLCLLQWFLCRTRSADGCFQAFLSNSWFGGIVFFGFLLGYL